MRTANPTTQTLRLLRSDVQALTESLTKAPAPYLRGYRAAVRDVIKVINRAIRRSGDGRAS